MYFRIIQNMRKIVIQKDKLIGSLFNEKECVLYKKWFAEFMNDNFTPVEFVIAMFISVFRKEHSEATNLTLKIHTDGSAIAGIFPYEIAEQKVADAISMARANGHPLLLKAEQE